MASDHERLLAIKAFEDSKAGVKGLVDAGATAIPSFFHHPPETLPLKSKHHFAIPVIDLAAGDRLELVAQVKAAAQTVGFFQLVNHGVPDDLLAEMLASVRRFHESPTEMKQAYYSHDVGQKARFNSNYDVYESPAANWRDTMFLEMSPVVAEEIPVACRAVVPEYARQVQRVVRALFELLSEALGLDPSYLEKETACLERLSMGGHYYPVCPEPDLTLGLHRHSDLSFLTVVLQDAIGGLQVLVDDDNDKKWVDVPVVAGALVVNVGDYLQLMSNDMFKSVEHRVVAKTVGPRVSVACFIWPDLSSPRVIAPIVTEGVARYRSTTVQDMFRHYSTEGLDGLQHLRIVTDHERLLAIKAFDDTMAGVKGLVDAGVTAIPSILHHPPEALGSQSNYHFAIPVIDLAASERAELVAQVKAAAETVGFFQLVNHGVPDDLLAEMLASVRRFHESPAEVKRSYYSRDGAQKVRFTSNFDLLQSQGGCWRDTMFLEIPQALPEEIPVACRAVTPEYAKQVQRVGSALFEILSEALGLNPKYLEEKTMCLQRLSIGCHYYPACPEPHLTLGTNKHCDLSFLTVLLQDAIGGLQVLVGGDNDKKWVDVPAVAGALVVNVGDYLQLMSNDTFISVEHRVVANTVGPRVSAACYIRPYSSSTRLIAPIVTEGGARYRATTVEEMYRYLRMKVPDGTSSLQHLRI